MESHIYLQSLFQNARCIGFKAGTDVNVDANGQVNQTRITQFADDLVHIIAEQDINPFFIISGAIRIGKSKIPDANNGAAALIGQSILVDAYRDGFAQHGLTAVGPLLETHAALDNVATIEKARDTVESCMDNHLIPLINGNDPLELRENKDNDGLASIFAQKVAPRKVDAMIYLSNHALYTADPSRDPNATRIEYVDDITKVMHMAQDTSSRGGTGGMRSKLEAFAELTAVGIPVALIDATQDHCLQRAIEGDQTLETTVFVPQEMAVL